MSPQLPFFFMFISILLKTKEITPRRPLWVAASCPVGLHHLRESPSQQCGLCQPPCGTKWRLRGLLPHPLGVLVQPTRWPWTPPEAEPLWSTSQGCGLCGVTSAPYEVAMRLLFVAVRAWEMARSSKSGGSLATQRLAKTGGFFMVKKSLAFFKKSLLKI